LKNKIHKEYRLDDCQLTESLLKHNNDYSSKFEEIYQEDRKNDKNKIDSPFN